MKRKLSTYSLLGALGILFLTGQQAAASDEGHRHSSRFGSPPHADGTTRSGYGRYGRSGWDGGHGGRRDTWDGDRRDLGHSHGGLRSPGYGRSRWDDYDRGHGYRHRDGYGGNGYGHASIGYDYGDGYAPRCDPAYRGYGVGYSGIAYLDASVKVIMVSESEKGPFLAPTYENVALATYPLSRLVFFNTNKAPGKPLNAAVEEFLRFILSREGQQIVLDHAIYMPLRAAQLQGGRAMLGK